MTEIEPTQEDMTLFDFGFSNDYEVGWDVGELYHYRSSDTVLNGIINADGVHLRLTHSDAFPDKFEGKAIEVFYDIALEELFQEQLLSEEQFTVLSKSELHDKKLFIIEGDDGILHASMKEYDAYILCFSTEKDDIYMFKEYGKHGADKFCLGFSGIEIKELAREEFGHPIVLKLMPVLYGKKAVVYLKARILEIVNKYHSLNEKDLIGDMLQVLQYAAKRFVYHRDNEIRLVAYIPKDEVLNSQSFEKYDEEGKSYLYIKLPKYELFSASSAPWNTAETTDRFNCILKEYAYDLKVEKGARTDG